MAEFIAANDLPITETSEVDVLCVENGELKRKPVASLGGGGGGGGYVIRPTENDEIDMTDMGIMVVSNESFDNYADIVYNGGSIWIDVSILGDPIMIQLTMAAFDVNEDAGTFAIVLMGFAVLDNLMIVQVYAPNGTWRPPVA